MSKLSRCREIELLGGPRNCQYGAPMGSADTIEEMSEPFHLFRCRMHDGAYLLDGTYYGGPANIYCAANSCGERSFTRAPNRKAAMATFDENFPGIRWLHK